MVEEASCEERSERLTVFNEMIDRSHQRMKQEMETHFSDVSAMTFMIQREYHDDSANRVQRRMKTVLNALSSGSKKQQQLHSNLFGSPEQQ